MFDISEKIFCAFCKLPRKVYKAKHVGWTNVLLSAALSFLLMFGFWQGPDGRILVFFSVFIIITETFIYLRWRMALKCPHCAFDPILYKSDRNKCVALVKEKLHEVRSSGRYLLQQNNPFQNLPVRSLEDEKNSIATFAKIAADQKKSNILSRQV